MRVIKYPLPESPTPGLQFPPLENLFLMPQDKI